MLIIMCNILIFLMFVGIEKLCLYNYGRYDNNTLNMKSEEVPLTQVTSSSFNSSAKVDPDRVSDTTEKIRESHTEPRQLSKEIQMPLSEAFQEKLAICVLTVTFLFLGDRIENSDRRLTTQEKIQFGQGQDREPRTLQILLCEPVEEVHPHRPIYNGV